MHYVFSDLHGAYHAYLQMLEKINFSDDDTLYVLGDILDRGPEPIKIIVDLMARSKVTCLAGNHEVMALQCLQFLMKDISEKSLAEMDENTMEMLLDWQRNGSSSTIHEFCKLSKKNRNAVLDFIADFELYQEIRVCGKDYILVHAGLGNFSPDKDLWEYELRDLVWERTNYEMQYYPDKIVVTGHTPTMCIAQNPRPGYIYRANNHIAIDCGAGCGGRLACLCLETDEEFYVEINE